MSTEKPTPTEPGDQLVQTFANMTNMMLDRVLAYRNKRMQAIMILDKCQVMLEYVLSLLDASVFGLSEENSKTLRQTLKKWYDALTLIANQTDNASEKEKPTVEPPKTATITTTSIPKPPPLPKYFSCEQRVDADSDSSDNSDDEPFVPFIKREGGGAPNWFAVGNPSDEYEDRCSLSMHRQRAAQGAVQGGRSRRGTRSMMRLTTR